VKCWVFKREIFGAKDKQEEVIIAKPKPAPRERKVAVTKLNQA
jgi:hypothetical protein